MRMRKLLIIVGFILSFFQIKAEPQILWLEKGLDLGEIEENNGEVEGSFQFINIGNDAVIIDDIRTSCGCTKVEFPRYPILKGDTALIKFAFDPKGRPGKNNKQLKVYFNGSDKYERLQFRAKVIGEYNSIVGRYPIGRQDLRFENETIRFPDMARGSRRHAFIGVYNESPDTIRPVFKSTDRNIEVNMKPESINPGEMATLIIYLNTIGLDKDGLNEIEIDGKWGEGEEQNIKIKLSVILLPDVSGPRSHITEKSLNLHD